MAHWHQTLYCAGILLLVALFIQQGNCTHLKDIGGRVYQYFSKYFGTLYNKYNPQCNCSCGILYEKWNAQDSMVVKTIQYPWMVRIFYKNRHSCGGTLINDKYVLTAASCVKNMKLSELSVAIGEQDFCEDTDLPRPIESFSVLRVKMSKYNSKNFDNNLALLELTNRVPITKAMTPICLPIDSNDEYVNRMATTAGWGLTVDWDQPLCRLKKINVSILESMDCSSFKQSVLHIPSEFQICVGHGKSRLGPCMGDVGGPLMRSRDDKRLEIIGIVSHSVEGDKGINSCTARTIYTKTFKYLKWIIENTKNACYCQP